MKLPGSAIFSLVIVGMLAVILISVTIQVYISKLRQAREESKARGLRPLVLHDQVESRKSQSSRFPL